MKRSKLFLASVFALSLVFIFSVSALGTLAADLGDTDPTITLGTYNGVFGFSINRADSNLFDNDELSAAMPGDVINEKVTVKSDYSNSSSFKIYLYALPASESIPGFLQSLTLRVFEGSTELNVMNAGTDNSSKGVFLGEFSPGSSKELKLDVTLPLTMDNTYQGASSNIEWHFYAEEITGSVFYESYPPNISSPSPSPSPSPSVSPSPSPSISPVPTELPDDNTPGGALPVEVGDAPVPTGDTPQTGDNSSTVLWVVLMVTSGSALVCLLVFKRKSRS